MKNLGKWYSPGLGETYATWVESKNVIIMPIVC